MVGVGSGGDRRVPGLGDAYLDRSGRHVSAGVVEVEARGDEALARKIAAAAGSTSRVVALEAGGRQMGSEAFARWLGAALARHASVAFLVGGPEGFPPGVAGLVHEHLSLSQMTLPHRLARLFLLEQIYRAGCILHNEPYHRP